MVHRLRFLTLAAAVVAAPLAAHHSFAMFDTAKEVTLSGTVREFQWTNPHSWLQLEADGKEYSIELGSPNTMVRKGWRKTTFKPGDKVTVTINPMRDGSPGGAFVTGIDAGGTKLSAR
ncbi:hypothetical protein GRI89_04545 [Altererythrobacter salegens]|uniref:Uncharacterized protein n=1 Tax=Croceibacterium salegens TaxID=1737568 RepID=A0A6I4STF9_9SPHN|nr:DUF6152 family protein [Croceibacterium salegens]MXO58809.1 hypothetical protein [Croceibacterium salegens]